MYGEYRYGSFIYGELIEPSYEDVDTHSTDLMSYLPSYYQSGTNVAKLMQIVDKELGELFYYAKSLGEQSIINKSTWGLNTWEKELDITHNPTMSIVDRREVVSAKVRGRGPATKKMIMNTAEAFSGGEVNVIEYPDEHYFIIQFVGALGVPKNMQAFIDMLDLIKPAHLEYVFKYTYTLCKWLIDRNVRCSDLIDVTCTDLKTYNKGFIEGYMYCEELINENYICNDLLELTCMDLKMNSRVEVDYDN